MSSCQPRASSGKGFVLHNADIGAPHATDQDILDHVDDITALMLARWEGRWPSAATPCCSTTAGSPIW
jgi:hypothetical protein